MTRPSGSNGLKVFAKPPLLITESAENFASSHADFAQAIKPRDVVEQMYVDDIAALSWEIERYQRCKAAIINTAFKGALQDLLSRLLGNPDWDDLHALVENWFSKSEAKKEVSELLAEYHLDESAIEAEAIRNRSADLEVLDRMLASLESRRFKALRTITDYRQNFSKQRQQPADQILDNDDVPRLVAVGRRLD